MNENEKYTYKVKIGCRGNVDVYSKLMSYQDALECVKFATADLFEERVIFIPAKVDYIRLNSSHVTYIQIVKVR